MRGINNKRFDELKATGLLPTPTGVGMEILRLTQTERSSVKEIARIIQSDPTLTGRTLKFANNGNAASTKPITSIQAAVIRLGMRTVNGIALGFSVLSNSRSGACAGVDYSLFWSRSLVAAIATQELCRKADGISSDEGFTCGLLSQIGRLALATVHPKEYTDVLEKFADDSSTQLVSLEQEAFATDHNELSCALIEEWGLPTLFAQAVLYHEDPLSGEFEENSEECPEEKRLSQVLHVAQQIADICVTTDEQQAAVMMPELIARSETIAIPVDDLLPVCDNIVEQWQEWGSMLDVATRPAFSFVNLLETSRQTAASEPAEQNQTPNESNDSGNETASADDSPEANSRGEGLRILVADDDAVTLKILTRLLKSSGHHVIAATNGREALRLALETNPQLIITDWLMPEMDGIEFCRTMRRTKFGRQVYIIVLTSQTDEGSLVEAFDAGADDYVVKPFQAKPLFARIRAGLRVIKLQAEVAREKQRSSEITAELAVVNRRLEQDAMTDALTGLPNRRYLLELLERDWERAQRKNRPLGCMMIDIDHFKQINDTYGHSMGDEVLKKVASVLKESLRKSDVVCRYGGEEFVVAGLECDSQTAINCAERLRQAIETEVASSFSEIKKQVTISVGMAVRGPDVADFEAMLRAADEAMYQAKQSGRNRICSADGWLNENGVTEHKAAELLQNA